MVAGVERAGDGPAHRRRQLLQIHRRRRALAASPPTRRSGPDRSAPAARIGGGDLPTITVDPEEPERRLQLDHRAVAHRGRRRHLDRRARRAGRRRLPEDLDQPRRPEHPRSWSPTRARSSRRIAAQSWSNWYTQPTAAMYHVATDNAFPYRVCGGQQDSGSGVRRQPLDGRRDHLPRLAPGQHPGVRHRGARPERSRPGVRQRAHQRLALQPPHGADDATSGPSATARAAATTAATCARCRSSGRRSNPDDCCSTCRTSCGRSSTTAHSWTRISPDLARADLGRARERREVRERRDAGAAGHASPRSRPRRATSSVLWAGTDDGNIQVTMDGGVKWTNVTPAAIKPWTRIFNIEAGHFDTRTAYAAANTLRARRR